MVMTEAGTDGGHDPLDAFLVAARAHPPEPSAALLARVLSDAEAVQAGFEAGPSRAGEALPGAADVSAGLWAGLAAALRDAVGGWRAMGGMATAAVTGVWIGMAGADSLSIAAGGLWGGGAMSASATTLSLIPDDSDSFMLAMELEG
ncbi:hypothetical protein SAMN05878426_102559 [Phaeovulum vinaykumarii]|uniref:Uncharacterized protein n=2 Tax=Phaeovulum vinaykumarii TaxID=407234 RepID=A0A1N7KVF8_9RHOB|nr:hypothetical protein SAMN05421795_102214 [Phaeovulum vinaykumarii]SOC01235.1 hypothetical protein SAMN05878426_102559 [Phaeovulum vinaykumarii]